MNAYKDAILEYVFEKMDYWPQYKLDYVQQQLREWMDSKDKHLTIDFFNYADNRLFYVKRLYTCRVDCFYQILKETESNPAITKIIQTKSSIVSFGCGPGPEIAAYISYVRNNLYCTYHELNILAVDCLKQWKTFINVVADIDNYSTVRFQAGTLCNQYLAQMAHSDICIMSYPHAMNFENIWINLKKKFTLIIFIDQSKPPLIKKAREHGFTFVNFQFNGNKTFFYHLDKNYDYCDSKYISVEQNPWNGFIERIKCARMLHSISSFSGKCEELISIILKCGHSANMYCFKDEKLERCSEMVKVNCARNKHESVILCGTAPTICRKVINFKRQCGHELKIKCYENEINMTHCIENVWKVCKRKLHNKNFPCSSFICYNTVNIALKCGHTFAMMCCEDEMDKINGTKCTKMVRSKCARDLHSMSYECGSRTKCNQMIRFYRPCGHKIFDKCSHEEKNVINNQRCMEVTTKSCKRGIHKKTMICSASFECEELVMHVPSCGHKTIIKCDEETSSYECNVMVLKKCKRNIHQKKKECHKEYICRFRYSLTLDCGCRTMVDCSNYNNTKNHSLKFENCKMLAKQFFISSEKKVNKNNTILHNEGSCRILQKGEICEEVCLKVLECGHQCQWRCFLCLNGRLHKCCLEKCQKRLKCGHYCADYCHSGECINCSKTCFLNKLKKFFIIENKMSRNDRRKWQELLKPNIEKDNEELKNMYEKILYDVEEKRFSNNLSLKYRESFNIIKYLLDFKNSFCDDDFPNMLEKYIREALYSLDYLIKWADPEDCNLDKSFNDVFEEVKTITSLCKLSKRYMEDNMQLKITKIFKILEEIVKKTNKKDLKEDLIEIFSRDDI